MDFSIITPSLNQLQYLKRCSASIMDQNNVDLEHIVIDGVSKDGTVEWLEERRGIQYICEPDKGMYDALNKGFRRSRGQILGHLNCDEQYLPGTLAWVKSYFDRHSEVDVLFGDALLVRPDGSLIAYWKGYRPRWPFILSSYLYLLTCAMFLRRRIIEDGNLLNPNFRFKGDAEFVVRLLRSGYNIRHVGKYLSTFTLTGKNISRDPQARTERALLLSQFPRFPRQWAWLLNTTRLAEKFISGAYFQSMPLSYSIYTLENSIGRESFTVNRASSRWRDR
jgi:glycosyltransferase involved in cell wall biosynthesis